MATHLMFGTLTQAATVSDKRTEDALALIRKYGGEFKAGYATLVDFINFRTAPAVSIDEFDKLVSA